MAKARRDAVETTNEWRDWLTKAKRSGYSLHELRTHLLEEGYDAYVVDSILHDHHEETQLKQKQRIATPFALLFLLVVSVLVLHPYGTITGLFGIQAVTTASVDFTDTQHTTPTYMYGVNTEGNFVLNGSPGETYDSQGLVDIDEQLRMWEATNLNVMRIDAAFEDVGSDGLFDHQLHVNNRQAMQYAVDRTNAGYDTKVGIVMGYMPSWLANTSASCTSNNAYCPPNDYTTWAELVLNFTKNITEDGTHTERIAWIECWNEFYGNFGMTDLGFDHVDKTYHVRKIHEACYDAIKAWDSDIDVIMPSSSTASPNHYRALVGNFSTKMDGANFHPYSCGSLSEPDFYCDDYLEDKLGDFYSFCDQNGVNWCTDTHLTEWSVDVDSLKLTGGSEWEMQLALYLTYMLRSPNISTTQFYVWQQYSCPSSGDK